MRNLPSLIRCRAARIRTRRLGQDSGKACYVHVVLVCGDPKGSIFGSTMKTFALLIGLLVGVYGYIPEKDNYFPELLRDVVERMSKDLVPYMDISDERLPLGVRSMNLNKATEEEQLFPFDYDALSEGGGQVHPSLRDQEFMQHSSLWGNQYMSGGAGEGDQRLQPEGMLKNRQEIKTDAALPAYCNPPNPCPIGYSAENGCLEEFKNTASFSRRYQAEQDCMCDTEHMFDCPSSMIPQLSSGGDMDSPLNDLEFNRFFQQALQGAGIQHKSLVAKKFNNNKKSLRANPFLTGERLPVAAKKGFGAREFY